MGVTGKLISLLPFTASLLLRVSASSPRLSFFRVILHRVSASLLLRVTASPLHRVTASPSSSRGSRRIYRPLRNNCAPAIQRSPGRFVVHLRRGVRHRSHSGRFSAFRTKL